MATPAAQTEEALKALGDPFAARLDGLRRLARSEMRAGGLPWAARRDVVVDLERLRLDPDLSPGLESRARSGITELRQRRPLRWPDSQKARYIAQHGRDRYLNHPDRLTPIGRLVCEARDKGDLEQHAAHRAISAACLAACVDLAEKATDLYDHHLLGVCIDYWQHQLGVERTVRSVNSWVGRKRQRHRAKKSVEVRGTDANERHALLIKEWDDRVAGGGKSSTIITDMSERGLGSQKYLRAIIKPALRKRQMNNCRPGADSVKF